MGSRHGLNTLLAQLAKVLPLENIDHSNVQSCEKVEIYGPSCSINHIGSFHLHNFYNAILEYDARMDKSPRGPAGPLHPALSSNTGNAAVTIPSGSHFETMF